jgi:hypothetical protein
MYTINTGLRSSHVLREGIKPSPTKRNASMTPGRGGGTAGRDQRSKNAAGTGIRRCGVGPPIFYRLAFKSRPPGGHKALPAQSRTQIGITQI